MAPARDGLPLAAVALKPRPQGSKLRGAAAVVLMTALLGCGSGNLTVASPSDSGGGAASPFAATQPASESPQPSAQTAEPTGDGTAPSSQSAIDGDAARSIVESYTVDLVRGDFPAAWAMLAPLTQGMYGSLARYQAERSAYFASVGGRYEVVVAPADLAPLGDWLTGLGATAIDPATAMLVQVRYPAISGRNAYSVYVVAPLGAHLVIYEVR